MPGVSSRLTALAWGGFLLSLLPGCVTMRPQALGPSSLSASARTPWIPPPEARTALGPIAPPDLASYDLGRRWSLPEAVDVALRNNPTTRAAWARARAAAEDVGVQRAAYAPTINLTAKVSGSETDSSQDGELSQRASAGPGVALSWLLLDVGGRNAAIESARQTLWAANWTQNAAIQDAVLATQRAYYQHAANKATLEARRASLHDARVHLDAADGRHRAGVATIADVLQARTVVAQAMLAVQTAEGQLETARG
ncbi:MAG: TolC family protein, partial [Deltaproteobacteria bacterium]|nr:TolC family protein [Deltaproteobacteria bacterium]